MDVGGMSSSSIDNGASDCNIIGPEEDERAFIEISELDKLLGLPPPRFVFGAAADLETLKVLESTESSCNFDSDIDFSVPQKLSKPQCVRMEPSLQKPETEVRFNKELSKVSVIKSELNIESDGIEIETECHGYLQQLVLPAAPPAKTSKDKMLYKSRGGGRGRGCKSGSLSRVVSKLLAKGDSQCLPPVNSICDNPIPKSTSIPSPVINKLKKLGTSVEVETPESSTKTVNGQVPAPIAEALSETSAADPTASDKIPTGYLQIMESLDKAVGLTSDLTKKKKRRYTKKLTNDQVPSTVQLLAEIDGSDNLTKFTFQVDTKQVRELAEGQKLYTCDICSGVYHRSFSLKRHYLKTHINYKHISNRDLHNCGILFNPNIEKGGARKKKLIKEDSPPIVSNLSPPNDIPDLYRCHTCFKCFMLISDLKTHLMEHPPVSVQNLKEDPFKSYTCPNCKARYQKKKLFLRHKEICGVLEQITSVTHNCLYCEKGFPTLCLRKKHHLQMHHPKKKLHQCFLCKTKMFKERLGVFKHLILHHPDEYIGCLSCKLRFTSREELKKHNKDTHKPLVTAKKALFKLKITAKSPEEESKPVNSSEIEHPSNKTTSATSSNSSLVIRCSECPKMFASHLNMTRHRRIAHRLMKQKKKLIQKKEQTVSEKPELRKSPTPPLPVLVPPPKPLLPSPTDPEVLFYSTIAHNIRENLTHHLDGKLDSQEVMEYDLNKSSSARNKLLNFSASFTSESTPTVQTESPTPAQPKEPRSTPISPRGQWEKFNFPKNYDGRCGLTSYIKDMSHLDISTQLTMRRNLQRLNSTASQEANKESPASIPAGLLLVEKPGPDCAESFGDPDDNKDKSEAELVLSGEWVRPRTFLCAACGYKSTNLWDTEDHKYALHPNVWVPHIEIVGEKSDSWDWFYHRRLPPSTTLVETTPAAPQEPPSCSKCGRASNSLPDLHRHMLDCGGDTTWMATMLSVTSPGSRRRKWRPFGSRRRRTTGRRGLKRNIPNTPAKHSCGRIRTKPGDMDTIQKMIANLPAKRVTRRVIGEDPDIKTRSQSTISSNRMLRKRRYKVPISSVAVYSNSARSSGLKSVKPGKGNSKVNQKKAKGESLGPSEEKSRNKGRVVVKEEPLENAAMKEEDNSEYEFQPLEAENTIQHSDILTSLQMIPVVRKSPVTVTLETQKEITPEEPIETSKIIAAMREAMLDCDEKTENKPAESKLTEKPKEKKKRSRIEKKSEQPIELKKVEENNEEVIICNGCGMQFDNLSACQRHKKKCVYWKEERTSDENKTNKCSHCGSVFPYLMALLKHDCSRVLDSADEPAMPELCPVRPVEEVQFDSVADIPILSPVEVARDEINVKRTSLLENTIREVCDESFDTSGYFDKYFHDDRKTQTIKNDKEEENKMVCSKSVVQNGESKEPDSEEKNITKTQQKNNENNLENESIGVDVLKPSKESPVSQSVSVQKLVQPEVIRKGPRNNKVSDMFKEVKRRGRKRGHKIKVKIPTKVLASKPGLRKVGGQSAITKKQMKKKSRSSNFVMLMKEWEKLQKEGAVAMGKRKRVLSNSEVKARHVHSRRRLTSLVNLPDYADTESVTTDTSSVYELSVRPRRSQRTRSIGTANEIPSELLKEITESCSTVSSENIEDDKADKTVEVIDIDNQQTNVISKELCNEKIEEESEKSYDKNAPVDHNPPSTSKDQPLAKKKLGRPRFKSITIETEQHIFEAIDSIIRSNKCSDGDVTKDEENISLNKATEIQQTESLPDRSPSKINTKEGNKDIANKENGPEANTPSPKNISARKQIGKGSVEMLQQKDKTEAHVDQTIEDIVNETNKQDLSKANSPSKVDDDDHISKTIEDVVGEKKYEDVGNDEEGIWTNVVDVIRNVSIGNADVFKDQNSKPTNLNITDSSQAVVKKRVRKIVGYKRLVKLTPDELNAEGVSQAIERDPIAYFMSKSANADKKQQNNNKPKADKTESTNTEKLSQSSLKGKRKLSFSDDDEMSIISFKPKEVKTKQLSIADYISISHFVKKSSDNAVSKESSLREVKDESKILPTACEQVSINDEKRLNTLAVKSADAATVYQLPSISEMSKTIENIIKKNSSVIKTDTVDDKPCSPASSSSIEDVALSVIREKVIQKKKKKLKLKKLAKNKRIEMMDNKISKIIKPKLPLKEEKHFSKDKKLSKAKKKVKVGVSRNRWEVSIIEDKPKPVEIVYEGQSCCVPTPSTSTNDSVKKFYCAVCDEKFESAYHLYEHQLSLEHIRKSTETEESTVSDDNDPVKFCKSIGNIINDLGKHTLNVAKVMHHLKHRESTDEPVESVAAETSGSSGCAVTKEEWPSRSSTPLCDNNQQAWEVDSFSTNCSSSIGSIMDTVNKLLASEPEGGGLLGGCSWADLQLAMGASDEEMAMLEQLGEHSLQEDYVYDSSRPAVEWPTLIDLDHPELFSPSPTPPIPPPTITLPPAAVPVTATSTAVDCVPLSLPTVRKPEPVTLSDSEESKSCRGTVATVGPGLPKHLLTDYETRVMVCPTCSKHFLGLPALQTHVAWAHQHNTSKGLRRRVLHTIEDVDRRLVCFVCKEIVSTANQLETHIQLMHTKRGDDQLLNKPSLSESAERLKSKMSLALGGLVDKALNKLLGTTSRAPTEPSTSTSANQQQQADVNTGALHLLGRLCAARKRTGNENLKVGSDVMNLLGKLRAMSQKEDRAYHEMRSVLSRGRPGVSKGALQASVNCTSTSTPTTAVTPAAVAAPLVQSPELKPTNLLDHLAVCSPDVQQRPYVCPICDLRFLIPSTRNRHIARAHGKYGRRYDETMDDHRGQDDLDYGWKDSLDLNVADDDSGTLLPLCSDCGLSFQSIHEVMQHRIEDHPRRFSADSFQDSKSEVVLCNVPVVESSSETKQVLEPPPSVQSDHVKLLPVSDNAIDSTSTSKKNKECLVRSIDVKTGKKRKLSKKKKYSQSPSKHRAKQNLIIEGKEEPEETNVLENNSNSSDIESSEDESNSLLSVSTDLADKSPDKFSTRDSDENLAELSKKLDRRKVRMGNMAEEAVRVKAEAALRELNLGRKNKPPAAAAKWGVNAIKFTKQTPTKVAPSSPVNGCPPKPKFASLIEKKWKMPAQAAVEQLQTSKKGEDGKSDVYDFEDEDLDINQKPFHQLKDLPDVEHSESNKFGSPLKLSASPQKAHHSCSKMGTDSS